MKLLGEFYREKILSLPKKSLKKKEFPYYSGEVKMEQDLFGWKLYIDKELIECRSEAEARFLKIFIEARMTEIRVPKDDEYLKSILPELEEIKNWTEEVLNSYCETLMNRQLREQLRHEVYLEITK
jgi:hypothetical protein